MDTSKDTYSLANYIRTEVPNEQLSPLEIPLIVDAIAYQICHNATIDDIKNFRLVNKLWKSAIPEPWKSGIRIHRIHQHPNSVKPEEKDAITLTQLRDLSDKTVISKGIIELQSWKLEENLFLVPTLNQLVPTLDNWFWTEYSSNISSLALINCDSVGAFTIYSEAFLKALPNLKTLRVTNIKISAGGWKALFQRFQNKREFFEHRNLRNLYLDMIASDEQFNHLWSTFQRSLPELENVSIKRLNRSSPSYEWAIQFLHYWEYTPGMKTLSFSELREGSNDELNHLKISRCTVEVSSLKIDWIVSQTSLEERLSTFPYLLFSRPLIVELHLSGQMFRNLCFVKGLKNLKVLIWNGNELDEDDGISLPPLDDITTYCKTLNSCPPKLLTTVSIHSSIVIGECMCFPDETTTEVKTNAVTDNMRMEFDFFDRPYDI